MLCTRGLRARSFTLLAFDAEVVADFLSLADARVWDVRTAALMVAPPGRHVADEPMGLEDVTPREIDVLEAVAEGLSNKAALNRTDAVRRAVRRGRIAL